MKQLTTTLVFLQRPGEVLLAMKKRGHGAGHWNGAGGKVEPGETIEQAMVRESSEEIGVTPTAYDKVAENAFYQLYKGDPVKNMVHIYLCTAWKGEPTESEEMAPQWFEVNNIPYAHMWPDDIHWLAQVLDGSKVSGSFYYDDSNQLTSFTVTKVEGFQ